MRSRILFLIFFAIAHTAWPQQQYVSQPAVKLSDVVDPYKIESALPVSAIESVDRDVRHVITLKIDSLLDPGTSKFKATVTVEISYDSAGAKKSEKRKLEVNYSISGKYVSKDAFVKEGMDRVLYAITDVSVSPPAFNSHVLLMQQLQFKRYFRPDFSDTASNLVLKKTSDGYLALNWDPVDWASLYDVEYTYTDDYPSQVGTAAAKVALNKITFDFRFNSTRIQVDRSSMEIPLVSESGYLIFRVRPVGYWGKALDKMITGSWSLAESGTGLPPPGEGRYFYHVKDSEIHEGDKKNWQQITAFSEHNKRKDAVGYMDGTHRNRQMVTTLNTQKSLVFWETIYDFNGRPAIEILPAPFIQPKTDHTPPIAFHPLLNVNATNDGYSRKDFDVENGKAKVCDLQFPQPMGATSGAGQYYSPSNPYVDLTAKGQKKQMAYTPDAEGYPFTQREYTPDNTGRLKRIGGPGINHHLRNGDSHERKFYYGTVSSSELDRVFGTAIGFARHYSKEMEIDENGQAHVTYKNLKGQVVATALAGISPPNVDPLSEKSIDPIIMDLAKEHNRVDSAAKCITATFDLIVAAPTELQLKYDLDRDGFPFNSCDGNQTVFYDCIYDLSISITDDCGRSIWSKKKTIGNLSSIRGRQNTSYSMPKETVQLNEIGKYTITKVLTVNERAVDVYIKDYLSDPSFYTCKVISIVGNPPTPGQGCKTIPCAFIQGAVDLPAEAVQQGISLRAPIKHLPRPQPTPGCSVEFGEDRCSLALQQMLVDVSPGGQYGEYDSTYSSSFPLSLLNEFNQITGNGSWRQPVVPYMDEDGFAIQVVDNTGNLVPPERLSLKEFILNWKESMAYSLLPYHPEYWTYEWCVDNKIIFDHHDKILNSETYADASNHFKDLFDTTRMPDHTDPLFLTKAARDTMQSSMNNYLASGNSMYEIAALAAAGFGTDPNVYGQYLIKHGIYSEPSLANDEWNRFKYLYLDARTGIVDQKRIRETFDNNYIGVQPPYEKKSPVFPSNKWVKAKLEKPVKVAPPPSMCGNCTKTNGIITFLNLMLQSGKLYTPGTLHGAPLSTIASAGTDAAISAGGTVMWSPQSNPTILEGSVSANSFKCSIRLELSSGNDQDTAQYFNWSNIIGFSCLKATDVNKFTLVAYDSSDFKYNLEGQTDCVVLQSCVSSVSYNSEFHTYTGEFVDQMQRILKKITGASIQQEVLNPMLSTPNPLFDIFPNSRWSVRQTGINNPKTFPISLAIESYDDKKHISCDICFNSSEVLIGILSSSKIISYELIPDVSQNKCHESNIIKVIVEANDKRYEYFLLMPSGCFSLGRSCPIPQFCCAPIFTPKLSLPKEPSCEEVIRKQYDNNVKLVTTELIKNFSDSLRAQYIKYCLGVKDNLLMNYEQPIYHFTLSYYDRAGNLIKTVPPKGVHFLTKSELSNMEASRKRDTTLVPAHIMASTYQFNSFNNPILTSTPDEGETRYCYDEASRILYSQDAFQRRNPAINLASFTSYDQLGRIVQAGQIPIPHAALPTVLKYADFRHELQMSEEYKTDVFTTYYDQTPTKVIGGFDIKPWKLGLKNQRNRISANTYHKTFQFKSAYTHAFFYSYDAAGNIQTLFQDFRHLENYAARLNITDSAAHFHRLKKIEYDYDLISGNVNMTHYQPAASDEFIHRYSYDEDNQLVKVRTSGRIWEDTRTIDKDAAYKYYLHGPLARLEIGDEKLQGLDYTYTIQGWQKGTNSTLPEGSDDMGADDGSSTLRDVTGYTLNYFSGDYKAIKGPAFAPDMSNTQLERGFSKPLYNGNIRNMITAIDQFAGSDKILATAYKYDALQRLTTMQAFGSAENQSFQKKGAFTDRYATSYAYDPNGNIEALNRNDEKGNPMDKLSYQYNPANNQLASVSDQVGIVSTSDLDKKSSFFFDLKGRLVSETEGPVAHRQLEMAWTNFDKLRNVRRNDSLNLEFEHNGMTQRSWKFDEGKATATYYVRDIRGNPIAIYELTSAGARLQSMPIYGAGRLGMWNADLVMLERSKQRNDGLIYSKGSKEYELGNHLGNVLTTISDRKVPDGNAWKADILTAQDYYPFGMPMPGRSYGGEGYRYGFNGKEKDDSEEFGNTVYDYGARIYNPTIGRWFTPDPLAMKYPFASPYNFVLNTPIQAYDPDGKRVYFIGGAGNDSDGWNYKQRFKQIWDGKGIKDVRTMTATHGKMGDVLFTHVYKNFSERKGTTTKITFAAAFIILENAIVKIKATVNAIVKDLEASPLEEGEQFNLSGYSYGSVLQAHVAIALADKGIKVDNLSLIGSPISDDSELMGTLQKYKKEGKIGNIQRVDIDGDNLSNPSSQLQYLKGGYESSKLGEGNNAHHFDLARPGKEADKKIGEAADKLKSKGVK